MILTKPMLGLAVGGALGLLMLERFFRASLAAVMGAYHVLVVERIAAGMRHWICSQRVHSMLLGILAGIGIAAALSLLVIYEREWLFGTFCCRECCSAHCRFATQRFGPNRRICIGGCDELTFRVSYSV